MKTPTLEEVKKRFENAFELKSCYGNDQFYLISKEDVIYECEIGFAIGNPNNQTAFVLYDKDANVYAEITGYKEGFEPTTEKQPNALDEFVESHFKDSDRLKYIDVALRLANIQLNQELLVKVVKVVDLVNEKGGKVSVEDIVKL
jgi:hypothetical protein